MAPTNTPALLFAAFVAGVAGGILGAIMAYRTLRAWVLEELASHHRIQTSVLAMQGHVLGLALHLDYLRKQSLAVAEQLHQEPPTRDSRTSKAPVSDRDADAAGVLKGGGDSDKGHQRQVSDREER